MESNTPSNQEDWSKYKHFNPMLKIVDGQVLDLRYIRIGGRTPPIGYVENDIAYSSPIGRRVSEHDTILGVVKDDKVYVEILYPRRF